ncbi:MAG: hypothetical protein AAGP08_15465 [Pseudomonadota bacterium]
MTETNKKIAASTSYVKTPREVEVIGPVGNARFRMAPLDIQRVKDLFVAHDTLQATKIAA